MKTVKQWLDTLEEPHRTKALNNTDKEALKETTNSLLSALMKAFIFHYSPEGQDYWWDVLKNN